MAIGADRAIQIHPCLREMHCLLFEEIGGDAQSACTNWLLSRAIAIK
jgi:hypothetical protein